MDDLEEIWGPGGRATLDPASVRPVPQAVAPPLAAPAPAPAAASVAAASAVAPVPAPLGAMAPASTVAGGQPHLGWVAAGLAAAVVAVLFVAVAARSSPPPPRLAASTATPTTIVSAAADLLGRGRVTTTTAWESTAGAAASPAGPAPAAPATAAPSPPPPAAGGSAPASGSPVSPAAAVPALALAEETAHRFVDVIARRDCDGLWDLLSRGTKEFLVGSAEPGERSGRDELCDGLRTEEAIPAIRVHGPAEARGERAVVPLESEGEVEPLTFVAEDGRWVIDLFGDFAETS